MTELTRRLRLADVKARLIQAANDRDAATRGRDEDGYLEADRRLNRLLEEYQALKPA